MPPEIDLKLNEEVSDIASALEEAVIGLMHRQPLDTSKVNAAVEKFDSSQDRANALCTAVQQMNPKHMAADKYIPPLSIEGEKGGTNWGALRVFTNLQSNNDAILQETVYILPVPQDVLNNLKCDMGKPAQQADATTHTETPTLNPEHK